MGGNDEAVRGRGRLRGRPAAAAQTRRCASQVRATSKTATAELGHLLGFKLLQ